MLTSIGRLTGLTYDKDPSVVPVDGFQEKPVDPQTLIARVNALLGRKETR